MHRLRNMKGLEGVKTTPQLKNIGLEVQIGMTVTTLSNLQRQPTCADPGSNPAWDMVAGIINYL